MKEFTIGPNDAGQRLDRWLAKTMPLLPVPLAQKYIRLKRVKVNGKGSKRDVRLQKGDLLQLYINDEFFDRPTPENAFLSVFKPQLDILYEDEHLLLLNKRPGMVVHPDDKERVNTLITHIQAYLYQKKEWSPYWENSFAPALCNRIDRNTGGIVIAAKTAPALRVMNQKIRDRELQKLYLCVVHGVMKPREGQLKGYILKDEERAQVKVYGHPVPGGKTAVTLYRTLDARNGLSLVECDLITGRTHQIRAQFAAAGCPLLGDGKYGRERDGKRYDRRFQALYSYKLRFDFTTDAGPLDSLNGREWTVEDVDFVQEYFPKERAD
jgi:23S rRNA pseudouridine955/2504/2580 synthase